MLIYVMMKSPGKLHLKVDAVPFYLENEPHTLRELIAEAVHTCLGDFTARAKRGTVPLTDDEMSSMREVGKFAFGVHYNENPVSEADAVSTAISAVEDGLVRIFRGDTELCGLDGEISVKEGDTLTFVRLTMLSGLMW